MIQGRFDDQGVYVGGPYQGETTRDSVGVAFDAPDYLGVQAFAESMFFLPMTRANATPTSLYDAKATAHQADGVHLFTPDIRGLDHAARGRQGPADGGPLSAITTP